MTTQEKVENWFVPLSTEDLTLKQAHSQLDEFGLEQEDVIRVCTHRGSAACSPHRSGGSGWEVRQS